MGFSLHEFVSCRCHPQLQAQLTALDPFDADSYTCLITGPPKSGKTSLLMHFALSEAASGRNSVFVCQRDKIEKDLPVLPEGMDPHHNLLNAVHMKYVSNAKELVSFAIDGRFLTDNIDSIVVDDLALLLPPEREKRFENRSDMFRMLASLYELCKTLREKGKASRLVVTGADVQTGFIDRFVYSKWLHARLSISGNRPIFQITPFEEDQTIKREMGTPRVSFVFACDVFKASSITQSHSYRGLR